jgi:adenine-specific DNA-methyltransferase
MPAKKKPAATYKAVVANTHAEATRKNIPSAEMQPVVDDSVKKPIRVAYDQRNPDLDPQLVWRGKSDVPLDVPAPPLYIQEKIHPKALIDDLKRQSKQIAEESGWDTPDLFADFNGLPKDAKATDFYQHEGHWSNRMILGDSLQVMASLAEREGLRGKVQCIYFDPPYGIKFNSNFQWSTTSRDVKDGKADHITREPEQVKAFRDTWRDGIHSYLTYLRDRLTVARDLLTDSGSIFVQIGDENVHRVRAIMDDVFGEDNFCATIAFRKTGGFETALVQRNFDHVIWYSKSRDVVKFRSPLKESIPTPSDAVFYDYVADDENQFRPLSAEEKRDPSQLQAGLRLLGRNPLVSDGYSETLSRPIDFRGQEYTPPPNGHWKTTPSGLRCLERADRLILKGKTLRYVAFWRDFAAEPFGTVWADLSTGGFTGDDKTYVVQTDRRVIQRCLLMTTDPGDLVLDPTCGSGTTATVAEQWGRRWITIDTSRVALALARARIMGARYPFYLLSDSREGQIKEAEVTHTAPRDTPTQGNLRHGFVYERVPHITLKSIANNTEINVIWEQWEPELLEHRQALSQMIGRERLARLRSANKKASLETDVLKEWELPRETPSDWDEDSRNILEKYWAKRIKRQKEIDASIAAKAEFEYLYDKPYTDNKRVRVAGPFTVESLSPHRVLGVDENDELIDKAAEPEAEYAAKQSFPQMILENLKTAGVQQAHKEGRITFTALTGWPGEYICGEGKYEEGDGAAARPRRAAIFIGPEFGTVTRVDLVAAAREARDAGFDVLIACAFNYEAHTTEFNKLADLPVLKARMNADLHMAEDLKNTGKGNLFVIFGEPDISLLTEADGRIRVKVNGVDVFRPNEGKVESSGPDEIACWFIDTDYNEESFFVRHAYFLGANDPYKSLKTTLKAEIDEDAWATLHSDTSRPFAKPKSGRIAVKVINHLGDEVMKVFKVAGN